MSDIVREITTALSKEIKRNIADSKVWPLLSFRLASAKFDGQPEHLHNGTGRI
jgi:hypothetical protein